MSEFDNNDSDDISIDEMLQRLEDVKIESENISEAKTRRKIRFNTDENINRISVLELDSPSHDDISFYQLMRSIMEIVDDLGKEHNYQSRKINRVHHDLHHINNSLISIDNSIHISNMLKLYEKGMIGIDYLTMEIGKISNIKLNETYDEFGE